MLVSELIVKNITNRNINPVRDLGVTVLGEFTFHSIDLFERNVPYPYKCVCDDCNTDYKLCWAKFCISDEPSKLLSLCPTCRSSLASKKMIATKRTAEFRTKQSTLTKSLLANDPQYIKAHMKARAKRTEGWCKTEHAKQIAISNLSWRYGEYNHNFNPNKSQFKKYLAEVTRITNRYDIQLISGYKPNLRGRNGVIGAIQLDHIVSVKTGFTKGIAPEVIGHICNLQFVPWELNRSKWATNKDSDVDVLHQAINKFHSMVILD